MNKFFKNILFFITLLLFIIGCSYEKEIDLPRHLHELENLKVFSLDSDPDLSIELIRETTFGDAVDVSMGWVDDIVGFGWFAGIEIDDFGRVFIGDHSALTVHVFDSDGSYLTRLGGEGSGPGELRVISEIKIISSHLYIFDPLQFHINIYSLDSLKLSKVKDVYLNRVPNKEELSGWHASRSMLINEDSFLAGYMEHPKDVRIDRPTYNLNKDRIIRYYFVDKEGRIISHKIFELKDEDDIVADVDGHHLFNFLPLPFLSKSLISISDDNHLYTAWTEHFLIKVYDSKGNYLHAFFYPFQNKPLNRNEIISMFDEGDERSLNLVQHADLPETWPAINSMIVDDENRLWISTHAESQGMYEWWILQKNGELIAQFKWPDNRSIEAVKNGYAYTRETVDETNLQQIVRYRIEFKEV